MEPIESSINVKKSDQGIAAVGNTATSSTHKININSSTPPPATAAVHDTSPPPTIIHDALAINNDDDTATKVTIAKLELKVNGLTQDKLDLESRIAELLKVQLRNQQEITALIDDLNLSKISQEVLLGQDVETKRSRDQVLHEVESLKSSHSEEVESIKIKHLEELESIKIKHSEELESLCMKHLQDMEQLQNKSTHDIEAQHNKHAIEIKVLEDAVASGNSSIELLKQQIEDERCKIQALHEQQVSMTTQLTVPCTKKAYLMKEGHLFRTWNKRFVVLEAGLLTYYVESTTEYPYGIDKKGELSLKSVTMSVDGTKIKLSHIGSGSNKDFNIEIKSSEERDEWSSALQAHIDYCIALRQA
jgi:hypothetical protein